MAMESISFPEEFIPEVVDVIRHGLEAKAKHVDPLVVEQLGKQCDQLMDYWDRLTNGT